jgi:hypothetical protein
MVTLRQSVSFAFSVPKTPPVSAQIYRRSRHIDPIRLIRSLFPDDEKHRDLAKHSPRVFIFGDPVVRRESSSGGLPEEAMTIWLISTRDTKRNQRSGISIEPELETKRLIRSRGSHIPCDLTADSRWLLSTRVARRSSRAGQLRVRFGGRPRRYEYVGSKPHNNRYADSGSPPS